MGNKVFVTYSWDDREHMQKVVEFVEFLRRSGFEADLDRNIAQSNTAMQFKEMMQEGLRAPKVIVVLSEGYKDKADDFRGGVGTEYRYIIEDIDENKNKYILVSFDSISDQIVPMMFKGRYIVDLKEDERNDFNDLFSKLMDEKTIELSPVAENKPRIKKEKIGAFSLKSERKASTQTTNVNIQNQINNDFGESASLNFNFGSGTIKVENNK